MLLDFLPNFASWNEWNGNLNHYFAEQQFSSVSEDNWRQVAMQVTGNPVFSKFAAPDPLEYDNWREWASALTQAVNGA